MDNTPRILWRKTDGTASLWTLDPSGTVPTSGADFGPFPGWLPTDIAVGSDNRPRVLWHYTDNKASVWTFNTAGTAKLTAADFTPPAGTYPQALSIGGDNKPRLLWSTTPSWGTVVVSRLDTNATTTEDQRTLYAPNGWTGADLTVGQDNVVRMLWNHASTNRASLWTLTADMSTRASSQEFGPYTDFAPLSLSIGPDKTMRLAWQYFSERVSYWQLNPAGTERIVAIDYQGSY